MAPIQSQNAYFIQKSSFNMIPSICHCRSSFVNDWEWWLPISRRGHFFQDSFFEDARAHFDAAVKEVLNKWGEMVSQHRHNATLSLIDNLNRYRQLRTSNRLQENLATTLVSDNNIHKIVMDVHDFMDGEVKVKVLSEKEVLVEGQGHGLLSSQSFSRRFCFPETVNMAAVTSVLSSDGVLTIEAPKTGGRAGEISPFASSSQKINNSRKSALLSASNHSPVQTGEDNKVFYCKDCKKKIGPWQNTHQMTVHQEGIKIPIQIDTAITKNHQDTSGSSASQRITSNKLKNNSQIKEIKVEKDASHRKVKDELKNEHIKENYSTPNNTVSTTSRNDSQIAAVSNTFDVPIATCFNTFPISRRGLFFNDAIFEDIRKDFQLAVQEVLSKWGAKSSVIDDLTCYRNLRSRDLQEDNQATKVTENEISHKVVLDVHDFMNGGDIKVKAINDREIVIEGHIEKQEGGSKSHKRFLKRFMLPGDIQLSSVTSDMSSDGVLTVTAPKKPSSVQLREFNIPLSIEEVASSTADDETSIKTSHDALDKKMLKNTCFNHQHSLATSIKNGSTNLLKSEEIETSNEHIIPVCVEGECSHTDKKLANMKREVKIEHQDGHSTNSLNETENSSKEIKRSKIGIVQEKVHSGDMANETDSTLKQANTRQSAVMGAKTMATEENTDSSTKGKCLVTPGSRYLPIARKGLFFSDSFFEEYQKDFETAVNDVLVKFRENFNGDMMKTYRSLRQRNLKVENQALRVHEDQNSFKVVLDVKDFTDGDITVYVEGEELVIEGRTERKEDKSSDFRTFSHRFLLPEVTNLTAISSAISSDGVLTINSPKTGNLDGNAMRKMSTEVESKHESHDGGNHHWEKKNVKESFQQSKGFSSRTLCSSYHSQQQHSS